MWLRHRRLVWVGLWMVFLGLGGCAGMGKRLEAPRISLVNIEAGEVKALETVFQIELRLMNVNDVPITISGAECELEINGRRFATGVSDAKVEVPSFGTTTMPVTVYSSVLEVVASVVDFLRKAHAESLNESVDYKISGRVRMGSGALATVIVPFETKGQLSVDGLKGSR